MKTSSLIFAFAVRASTFGMGMLALLPMGMPVPALAQAATAGTHAYGSAGGTPQAQPTRQRPPPLAIGAAFAPDGALWIVGLDPQRRLFIQRSTDQGRSWSEPHTLDVGEDTVSADGENRPKIAFGPRDQVVIAYTKPMPKPYTGDIRLLRSVDGGRSFSAPVTVHEDRSLITHRFESIIFDPQGVLHTVWIDKRDQEAAKAQGRPYRGAGIYRNESRDGGLTFGPDIRVADHSCECCRIALATKLDGGVAALWRHVFKPNERDHAFTAWRSSANTGPEQALGWRADRAAGAVKDPVRATHDRWALDACPHHGPGLSAAEDGGWHAVWFGIRGGKPGVRYGRLDAQGNPVPSFLVRTLPDEQAEHADVMAIGQTVVIAWRSFDGQRFRLRAWISRDGGKSFNVRELAQSDSATDQPRLVRHAGQVWVMWRDVERVWVGVADAH